MLDEPAWGWIKDKVADGFRLRVELPLFTVQSKGWKGLLDKLRAYVERGKSLGVRAR